ncbi:hypothetical protein N7492_009709 [Penicillium capsulatum]|uniref:Uncharacterized protein n=1 Tax=Penicillium capsulatum TaxID=69766 RepID=A0A9W9HRY5_9EURO|nr:hypothetical protein N7492_009709 [Penicillium capsulatum]KAJ6114211.1 hypothetical protein N7512_007656 [Penicillium capsulatum]
MDGNTTTLVTKMRLEPISKDSKTIVDNLRDYITGGLTKQSMKTRSGWRYEGDEFLTSVESLRQSMQKELEPEGFKVVGCTVRHFSRGANIQNPNYPTKRLLIIPINGTSTLSPGPSIPSPGTQLPPDTSCYIEDTPTPPVLSGEEIDVIFVMFEAEQGR